MRRLVLSTAVILATAVLSVSLTAAPQSRGELPVNDDYRFNGGYLLGGTTGVECTADTNDDGQVNVQDLTAVILDWGPCPGCASDIDGNDIVNVVDLTEVILQWGPCP